MIITRDNQAGIDALKDFLSSQFDMKDLGPLRYFFGTEVAYSPRGYLLCQTKHLAGVLQHDGIT